MERRRNLPRRLGVESLEPRMVLNAGPLVIGEFMAANNGALADGDGDFSDWIEVFNPTDMPIALDGWYLTDDASELTQWRFPNGTGQLAAGDRRIVFASAKDPATAPTDELHASFRLDADGEYLALVRPDGATVAHDFGTRFPRQFSNVSYGLSNNAIDLMPPGTAASYLVPSELDGSLSGQWPLGTYDDSNWQRFAHTPAVVLTEISTGTDDGVEIQNLSGQAVDTTGWVIAANYGSRGINGVHDTPCPLPPLMDTDEVLYRTDDETDVDHYWGENISWRLVGSGWVMILDAQGSVVDAVFWGYDEAEIAVLDVQIGVFRVTAEGLWNGVSVGSNSERHDALRRSGESDHDDATDWAWMPSLDLGEHNQDLAAAFPRQQTVGLGFDTGAHGLEDLIHVDLVDAMQGTNASLWTRIPFHVDSPETIESLRLNITFNDGFVAYINGEEVARHNTPDAPTWNSSAITGRSSEDSREAVEIDISDFLSAVDRGDNVLAVHGLNVEASDQTFLVRADLMGTAMRYFAESTPDEPNSDGFPDYVRDTKFSVDRGFFDTAFDVRISTSTDGAVIRYTTDGSEPTDTHGTRYNGPIHIEATTTLRAAAFYPGWRPSNVDTQTYLFLDDVITQPNAPNGYPMTWSGRPADYEMDPDVVGPNNLFDDLYRDTILDDLKALPTMSIVMDVDDLFGSRGIYVNPQSTGMNWEKPTSVELISPDGSEEGFHVNAGIRVQGGSSRSPDYPKHSFRLEFRNLYGPGKLDYPLFADQPHGSTALTEFDELPLRAAFNNSWTHWHYYQAPRGQYVRDQWVRDMQMAMGHESTHGRYVHLYLNGMYWGIYNVGERPAAPHLKATFGGDKDDYDVINSGAVIDGNATAWNAMFTLSGKGLANNANYEELEQKYLDIDAFIDYMILNHYVGNADWDNHNWIAGRNRETDDRFRFYAWDSEFAIALPPSNTATGTAGEQAILNIDRTGLGGSKRPSTLLQQLRANEEFRLRFADHVHKHLFNEGILTPEVAAESWNTRAAQVDRAVVAESARWGDYRRDVHSNRWPQGNFDLYTRDEHYLAQREFVLERYLPARTAIVIDQYRAKDLYPDVVAPQTRVNGVVQHGGMARVGDELSLTAAAGTIYYTLDGSDPRVAGGAVSTTAVAYAGPIVLDAGAHIQARVLHEGEWSALCERAFSVFVPADATTLTIAELNYNPHGADADLGETATAASQYEFVELVNISAEQTIDLAGVRFVAGISFAFPRDETSLVAPGQRVLVVGDPAAMHERYGGDLPIIGQFAGRLSNSGEQIRILDRFDRPIVDFAYNDSGQWPGRADGKGASLELIDPTAIPTNMSERTSFLEDAEHWRSTGEFGGSPGTTGKGLRGDVLISEILTHTDLPLLDSVELHNTTHEPIDLGGWYLSDSWGFADDGTNNYKKFQIPQGTILPADGYVVFDERDFNPNGPWNTNAGVAGKNEFGLNGAHGDDVWLVETNSTGRLTRFVDHVDFPAALRGESFGQLTDDQGDRHVAPMAFCTLGAPNSGPRIGPLVISEIMAAPADPDGVGGVDPNDLEFVELVNPTDHPVLLDEWRIRGGIDFDFDPGTIIKAGEAIAVLPFNPVRQGNEARWAAFADLYGLDAASPGGFVGGYSGRLSDTGETIRLLHPGTMSPDEPDFVPHTLEDEVDYETVAPWPTTAAGQSFHRHGLSLWGNNAASWDSNAPTPGTSELTQTATHATVVGRYLFYNNSLHDGNETAANRSDDAAIAIDKKALLPGETATRLNYTSYMRGINGLMIDIAGLPHHVDLGPAAFEFLTGNDDLPDSWIDSVSPSEITIRRGEGIDRSDRVTVIFPDGTVTKKWLQVRVLAGDATGLAEDDIFYFGNAVGEAGNDAANAMVTTTDEFLARIHRAGLANRASVEDPYDFNRDGLVNVADRLIARNNRTGAANSLRLIMPTLLDGQSTREKSTDTAMFSEDGPNVDWIDELREIPRRRHLL